MFALPAVVPAVNVAVQVAVPTGLVPWDRVQGVDDPNEEPVAVPVIANATVPAGDEMAPGLEAGSTTLAVHVEVPARLTDEGAQDTVAVVSLRLIMIAKAVVLELAA